MVTRWPGIKYIKSDNKKTKIIGIIASVLLIVSTVVTYWYAYVWTKEVVQSAIDSSTKDLGNFSF